MDKEEPIRNDHKLAVENSKSSGIIAPYCSNNLLYYKQKEKKRNLNKSCIIDGSNRKNQTNIKFYYDQEDLKKIPKYKRITKLTKYGSHGQTTQITCIPGGVKRVEEPKNRYDSSILAHSFFLKMNYVFKSKVSCLPNSMTSIKEIPTPHGKKINGVINKESKEEKDLFKGGKKQVKKYGKGSLTYRSSSVNCSMNEDHIDLSHNEDINTSFLKEYLKKGRRHYGGDINEFRTTFKLE